MFMFGSSRQARRSQRRSTGSIEKISSPRERSPMALLAVAVSLTLVRATALWMLIAAVADVLESALPLSRA